MLFLSGVYIRPQDPSPLISPRFLYKQVGVSIFKGGASTFVGVCLLSLSASYIFRLFFKMLFGIVALGLLVGYYFYPSILTLGEVARRRALRKK